MLAEARAKAEKLGQDELRGAVAGLVSAHVDLQKAVHGFIDRSEAAKVAVVPGPAGLTSLLSPADVAAFRWSFRAITRLSKVFGTPFETTRLVMVAMFVGVVVATTLTACVIHAPGIL